MTILEQFAKIAFSVTAPFTLQDEQYNISLIPYQVGETTYFLGTEIDHDPDILIRIKRGIYETFETCAFMKDGVIYVDNNYDPFFTKPEDPRPRWVKSIEDFWRDCNDYLNNVAFPEFYRSLIVSPDLTSIYNQAKEEARNHVLSNVGKFEIKHTNYFPNETIESIIAGQITLEDAAKEHLKSLKGQVASDKELEYLVNEKIAKGDVAKPWELEMGAALRNVKDVKSVRVEFCVNGRTASGKVRPEKIMECLIECFSFACYDFISYKEGKSVIFTLCTYPYCKDIIRITYNRKTLYERK